MSLGECPLPLSRYPTVQLAHGGGGSLTRQLIQDMFLAALDNPHLASLQDGAVLPTETIDRLAFTTDSYVVRPLFFPGGDIGKLAVCGTVNDLAMCGAKPLYLTLSFILEEGFPMTDLWRVVSSIATTASEAGVQIVTGDTKVVDRGHGDGVYINTAGIGEVIHAMDPATPMQPGDVVLINGDIGRHGVAIMAERESLSFETTIESDCAPLFPTVSDLLDAGITPHSLRDLTRGGLATALVELAETTSCEVELVADQVPVQPEVRGACEMLGLDPLYVANEGCMVVIVPEEQSPDALAVLQNHDSAATQIGTVKQADRGRVHLQHGFGATRRLSLLSGEQLPRIC